MCIAIAKPRDRAISHDRLRICFRHNPDGAGFAVRTDDGKVEIHKGFFDIESFLEAYDAHCVNERDALIHFRITTRGDDSKDNCHPFEMKNGALIHNGTISALGDSKGKGKSDTRVLSELLYDFDIDTLMLLRPLIEQLITYNKVAVMTTSGQFVVFNEGNWTEDEGVLYSNDGFKEYSTYHYGKQSYGKQSYCSYYSQAPKQQLSKQSSNKSPTPPPYHNQLNAALARQFGEIEGDDALFDSGDLRGQRTDDAPLDRFDLRKFAQRYEGNAWAQWGFLFTYDGNLVFDHDEDFRNWSDAIKRRALLEWHDEVCSEPPSFSYYIDRQIMSAIVIDILDRLYELSDENPALAEQALAAMADSTSTESVSSTALVPVSEAPAVPTTPELQEATA